MAYYIIVFPALFNRILSIFIKRKSENVIDMLELDHSQFYDCLCLAVGWLKRQGPHGLPIEHTPGLYTFQA